jgi:hypothetical protein
MTTIRRKKPLPNRSPRGAVIAVLRRGAGVCDRHARQLQEHATFRTLASLLAALADAVEATTDELAWLLMATTTVNVIAEARASEHLISLAATRERTQEKPAR